MNQPPRHAEGSSRFSLGDPIVLLLSIGFIVAFLGLSFYDIERVASSISAGFAWTALVLGSYFQLLLLLTFFIAMGVALTPAAKAKIGNLDAPEMSTFKWLSIILCTLLAGGGVFFAAGEPVYHFVVTPPAFDTEPGTANAVAGALGQSFMHWGFMAWAVLGSLTAVVLAHAHYVKGQPLQPRTLLYPVLGERLMRGPLGSILDACCVIALVAGTVGPIGFLATQVSFGLHELFGLPEGYTGQLIILGVLGAIYVLSSMSGVHKGIQLLSRFNVLLALTIGAVIILFGPTLFLVNTYLSSMGAYISEFFTMATMTAETAPVWWMQWWTVFFFAWFIGYAPLMAIFVARISRGPQHSRDDRGRGGARPDCHHRVVYAAGRFGHLLPADRCDRPQRAAQQLPVRCGDIDRGPSAARRHLDGAGDSAANDDFRGHYRRFHELCHCRRRCWP